MPGLSIRAVYVGLADAVRVAELQGTTLQVTATPFAPDMPTVPHFFPAEFTGRFHRTYGGLMEMDVTARLMISRATDETGHLEALDLAGAHAESIIVAIEGAARDATGHALNGACDDLMVRQVTGPRLYDYGNDIHFLGLEFTIFVMG